MGFHPGPRPLAFVLFIDKIAIENAIAAFDLPPDQVTDGKALNNLESSEFSVTKLREWRDGRQSLAPQGHWNIASVRSKLTLNEGIVHV